jgi:hypothetical protein
MFASLTIKKIVQVIIASLLVTCIFAHCPLSANAAGKKGGGTNNVQSNSAKRGTANSLSNAGTAGATKGTGGGVHSQNCSNCGPAVNNRSGKGGSGGGGGPGSGGSSSPSQADIRSFAAHVRF